MLSVRDSWNPFQTENSSVVCTPFIVIFIPQHDRRQIQFCNWCNPRGVKWVGRTCIFKCDFNNCQAGATTQNHHRRHHQHIINAVDCHRVKQRERAEASVQSGGSLWFCLHPHNVNVTDWTHALNVNCSLGSCENGIPGNRNRKRLVSYWWYWCVANEWSGLTINPSLVTAPSQETTNLINYFGGGFWILFQL